MSQFSFPFSVRDVIIILVPLLEAVWLERMTQSPFASIWLENQPTAFTRPDLPAQN